MTQLLAQRERLRALYASHSRMIDRSWQFLLCLSSLLLIFHYAGYQELLRTVVAAPLLALVCTLLPMGAAVALIGVIFLIELLSLSLEMAVVAFIFFLVVLLTSFSFRPGESFLILAAPLLLFFKLPYALAILVGLAGSLASVVPMSCGIFVWHMMLYVRQNSSMLLGESEVEPAELFSTLLQGVLTNKAMLVTLISCALAAVVVYSVKHLQIIYVCQAAMVAGIMTALMTELAGSIVYELPVSLPMTALSVALSVLLALIWQFFAYLVDYSRTEYLEYEDEDYHYYVRAVPKVNVTRTEVKVRRFNRVHRR